MKKKLLLSFAVFATALSVNAQKRSVNSVSPIRHKSEGAVQNVSFDLEKSSFKSQVSDYKRGSKTIVDTLRLTALNKAYACPNHAFITDRGIKSKLWTVNGDKYYVSINQAFNNTTPLKLKGLGVKLVSYNSKDVDLVVFYKTLAGKDTMVKITQNVPKYTTATTHFFTFPSEINVKDTFEVSIKPNSSTDSLLISTTGIYNRKAVAWGKISNDTLTVDNTKTTNNDFTTAGFFKGWMTDADGWMAGGGFASNFTILSGKNILSGTKVLKQFSATQYIVSKKQTVALDTIFGSLAQMNEEETYGYQSVYKVPATGNPQLLSSSLWDDGVSVAYKSDAYVYPLVEYVFNTNPVIDNKCLGVSKTVNVNLEAPSYAALVKNPLFNKNAFYGKYLSVGKKDYAFYALAIGKTKKDTIDFFSSNLKFSNTYSSDATNDSLTIVEHILGYGYKAPQYLYNVTGYLISSKVTATTSSVDASATKADGKASVVAAGGFSPYAYKWNNNETTADVTVAKGDYSVVVTDANGCTANASVTVAEKTNSINSLAINSLAIYPNPVANELNVKFNANSAATIELVNVAGQVIAAKTAGEFADVTFNTEALNAGVYFVNIKVAEGTFTQKIIKD